MSNFVSSPGRIPSDAAQLLNSQTSSAFGRDISTPAQPILYSEDVALNYNNNSNVPFLVDVDKLLFQKSLMLPVKS